MHARGGREVQSNLLSVAGPVQGVAGELAGAPAQEAGGEDLRHLVETLRRGEIRVTAVLGIGRPGRLGRAATVSRLLSAGEIKTVETK